MQIMMQKIYKRWKDWCINPLYFKINSSESCTNIRLQLHGHKGVISKSCRGSSHSSTNGNHPLFKYYGVANIYQELLFLECKFQSRFFKSEGAGDWIPRTLLDVTMKKVEPNVSLKLLRKVQISPPRALSNILFQISSSALQKALRILIKFLLIHNWKAPSIQRFWVPQKRKWAWPSILKMELIIFNQKRNYIQPVSAQ